MRTVCVDTETDYADDYSVADMGPQRYVNDPRFNCYMVSAADDEGWSWAGSPEEAPWDKIYGPNIRLLCVNTGFDYAVLNRLAELKLVPEPEYAEWLDCANLGAYLGAPRSLAGMSKQLLGREVSKEVRSKAKGRFFYEYTAEEQEEMRIYALGDATVPIEIWQRYSHLWPEAERWVSQHTLAMGQKGMPVNIDKVNAAVTTLTEQRDAALNDIPWAYTGTPLSKKFMKAQCEVDGIEMPASMAADSEECEQWEDKYASIFPWINAVRTYRRVNMLLSKVEKIHDRTVDGYFPFSLLYFGAHTGRFSGEGGVNMQNLPRDAMFGVDLRGFFEAPPGYSFVVVDLAAIEPRVTAYMAGDSDLLSMMATCSDVYEAQARAWGLYNKDGPLKKVDPELRRMMKTLGIGLCYQMGVDTFQARAGIPRAEAQRLHALYRSKNMPLQIMWAEIEKHLRRHSGTRQPCEFALPSGRIQRYHDVLNIGKLSAVMLQKGRMQRLNVFPGRITENLVQAESRDILVWHLQCCEAEGIEIRAHTHDELVALVPDDRAEWALATMLRIMRTSPPWAPGLPLDAEGHIMKSYTK
jgi:DNA polymerase family A